MAWAVSSPHQAPWKSCSRDVEGRIPGPGRRAHGSSYSPKGQPKTDRSRFEGRVLLDLRVAALGPCLPSPPPPRRYKRHPGSLGPSSVPRGPMSCRTTASPSLSGWPRVCSTWRKRPRYQAGLWPGVEASSQVQDPGRGRRTHCTLL